MTNRIHDDWTEEEVKKLKRYMKREDITSELMCEAEGWEGIMLDRNESSIAMKAIRILRERKEVERIENLFGDLEVSVAIKIIRLKLEGKTNEEILELIQVKFPKAKLSDVKRLSSEMTLEIWHDTAKRLGVASPKKLKDWRDFARLQKAYGTGINQFNKAKLIEILQDG